jgi:multicomponent Na+:H+ antiporter subunit E
MTESIAPIVRAAVLYALLWWVLARGDAQSLFFGALAVGVALAAARRLEAPGGERLRLSRLPRFFVFFVVHSLRGGVDVAMRALRPRMALAPAFVDAKLQVQGDAPRALVALTVSLLPGTLAARLEGDALTLHVLDVRQPLERELARVEREVAALFGQPYAQGRR